MWCLRETFIYLLTYMLTTPTLTSYYNNNGNSMHCYQAWIIQSYSLGGIHMYLPPKRPLAHSSKQHTQRQTDTQTIPYYL